MRRTEYEIENERNLLLQAILGELRFARIERCAEVTDEFLETHQGRFAKSYRETEARSREALGIQAMTEQEES